MKMIKNLWVFSLLVLLIIIGCLDDGGSSGCSSGTSGFTAPSDKKSDEESHLNLKTEQLIVLQI